ncbi:hypothetical protein K1T71_001794 [Dendrolimus kikuchii]|uniref:Uncharacterized protein n=1 Tax=Dendrolimus kikuchii TaxID=765133 RepID=A0ACC1DF52_9NEOP|nr:hypothetical protein K1T71_001794 [Dendrolimus kikuchii]
MACFYPEDCGQFAVAPMLVAPCYPTKCCEDPPMCYPCLPRCPPAKVVYCCDKKPPCTPPRTPTCHEAHDCCEQPPQKNRPRSPPPTRKHSHTATPDSCPTCYSTCKPVKTKYVIPCYRYEDGRINQPTVLMRRACEVACGVRPRRVPFVTSSYSADAYNEVHRYHSQDERGNCCYHFERKKPSLRCAPVCDPCPLSHPPASTPHCCEYVDCVHARPIDPSCCYFKY